MPINSKTPRLSVFANFFIDNEERFLRLKDSFESFYELPEQWVVNVRGLYRKDVKEFLSERLGSKLVFFEIDSGNWFQDSRKMLPRINGDYVFFWIEDHINLASISLLRNIVNELAKHDIDSIWYSWWWMGNLRKEYESIPLEECDSIDWFVLNKETNRVVQRNTTNKTWPKARDGQWIVSATSIFKHSFFEKLLVTDDPIIKRFPVNTPFDFEKRPGDEHWLPLRIALPKQELFASIDDDHRYPGTSLISRGLYPSRLPRHSYAWTRRSLVHRAISKLQPIMLRVTEKMILVYKKLSWSKK